MSDRESPYDERPDEKRPCPDCGGTHMVGDQDGGGEPCQLCGPPSRPAPDTAQRAHEQTAAYLRKLARVSGQGYLRDMLLKDADWHDRRAAQLAGLNVEVA